MADEILGESLTPEQRAKELANFKGTAPSMMAMFRSDGWKIFDKFLKEEIEAKKVANMNTLNDVATAELRGFYHGLMRVVNEPNRIQDILNQIAASEEDSATEGETDD